MAAFRFSILRQALLAALLALCLLSSAQANPTPAQYNRVFPAYPVDAAGCSALKAGGLFSVDLDPLTIKGIVSLRGMDFSAFIVPDTPVFRFFANNEATFYHTPFSQFDPSTRCFTNAVYGPDKLLHFAGIPPGKYIVFERTAVLVTYSGEDENTTAEPEPGMNSEIELVPHQTYTPYIRQYERTRVYGAYLTISADGGLTISDPKWLAGEGD